MTDFKAQTPDVVASATVDVAANLAAVRARIGAAAVRSERAAQSVTLVAVSKTVEPAVIRQALEAGHRVFGENRMQEAEAKWPALKADYPDVVLHLIGPLQRNKIRPAVALFDVIETVDREKLARGLAKEMERQGRHPDCYVQVNTGEEPQKAGIPPGEVEGLVGTCRKDLALPVRGLMCLPPLDDDPALHFALLATIAGRLGLDVLSMGMSADYEEAIELGATHVRVGTAIFGPRPT